MANSSHTFSLAYSLATTYYVAYVVSLWVRARRAKQRVLAHEQRAPR